MYVSSGRYHIDDSFQEMSSKLEKYLELYDNMSFSSEKFEQLIEISLTFLLSEL